MKKGTIVLCILCFLLCATYSSAQTDAPLPAIKTAVVESTPADSTVAAGYVLKIHLTTLENVHRIHVSHPGGATVYNTEELTAWELGSQAAPQGYAFYIKLASAPQGPVSVELEDRSGKKGAPITATASNQ